MKASMRKVLNYDVINCAYNKKAILSHQCRQSAPQL